MEKVAKTYWNLGLATLPTKKNKAPDCNSWLGGVKDHDYKSHGIGIVCGKASGKLECLDFDNHFGDAKANITRFLDEVKLLYLDKNFPIQETQSGGYHLFYRCEVISGNTKLAQKPKWCDKKHRFIPDAIIETRGEGGYFCVEPTPGYKVVRNSIKKIPDISIQQRDMMLSVAKSMNEFVDLRKDYQEQEGRPGDVYNENNNSIQEAKDLLRQNGWIEVKTGQWRRPDKKDGISATFGKVADNVFYVFTANAYPFEPNSAYTPFQILSLLKYKGDFKAAAKDLSQVKEFKTETKEKKKSEISDLLSKAEINRNIPVERPPVIMKIIEPPKMYYDKEFRAYRLFTLGNFSAIKGKSKSKKTFLTTMFLAAAGGNGYIYKKIQSTLPESKRNVLLFDTEQSEYDAYNVAKRVERLLGFELPNFKSYALRQFTPAERIEIINHALEAYGGSTGLVVIDGIADLSNTINDEVEASKVAGLLMKWTQKHNCHITTVIHENKNDGYATGHLGSFITKKAEAVISVEKVQDNNRFISKVSPGDMRGTQEFSEFCFEIDEKGLPIIIHENELPTGDISVTDAPF